MSNRQNTDDSGAKSAASDAQDPIMSQLRTMYDDIAAEPLPDELVRLLDKLDEAERKR